MGTPLVTPPSHQMPPIMLDAPITLEVHPSWRAPCWKFEKLQIMPLGFGYLDSSEKSGKKIHKYYTYRAIITEIYKAQWQALTEIQPFQNSNQGPISRKKNQSRCNGGMTRQN